MKFDASALLYAIASLSASFVAILGGFIASKLIAVNGEREAVEGSLHELTFEIELKEQEHDSLQRGLDTDDALDFIRSHSADVANLEELKNVYEETEQQLLSYDELLPYWEKATVLAKRFHEICARENDLNDDDIPCTLAAEVKDSHFEYETCSVIAEAVFPRRLPRLSPHITGAWYERDKQRICDLNLELTSMRIREEQLMERKKGLTKPKGMKIGLVIFALFSLFNIILPLVLSMVTLQNICQYYAVQAGAIVLLLLGLIATFWYLAWLLHWKPEKGGSEING